MINKILVLSFLLTLIIFPRTILASEPQLDGGKNFSEISDNINKEETNGKNPMSFNFITYFIDLMVEQGVPLNTVYMILILPVIVTFISFARQVIGIQSFGINTPSIITLSFLMIGLKYGLIILAIIILTGTVTRILARKMRLLYIPRMAILMTVVCLSVLITYFFGIYFGEIHLSTVSILPVLLLIVLTENFMSAQMERGYKESIRLTAETVVISIGCYFFVKWPFLRDFLLKYPEVIFLTILINIVLGRWTGLRLFEYMRFREVINRADMEE